MHYYDYIFFFMSILMDYAVLFELYKRRHGNYWWSPLFLLLDPRPLCYEPQNALLHEAFGTLRHVHPILPFFVRCQLVVFPVTELDWLVRFDGAERMRWGWFVRTMISLCLWLKLVSMRVKDNRHRAVEVAWKFASQVQAPSEDELSIKIPGAFISIGAEDKPVTEEGAPEVVGTPLHGKDQLLDAKSTSAISPPLGWRDESSNKFGGFHSVGLPKNPVPKDKAGRTNSPETLPLSDKPEVDVLAHTLSNVSISELVAILTSVIAKEDCMKLDSDPKRLNDEMPSGSMDLNTLRSDEHMSKKADLELKRQYMIPVCGLEEVC